MATTLVIATSSALVQRGMDALLRDVPELTLCASVNGPDAALVALRQHRPEVFVVDPDFVEAIRAGYRERHRPRVLLLSARAHIGTVPPCGDRCACGFVSERAAPGDLRSVLRIIGSCTAEFGGSECRRCPLRASLRPSTLPLSDREQLIFRHIGLGEGATRIAEILGLSVKTVETHRQNIKLKLGLNDAAALQEAAMHWKWGEPIPDSRMPDAPGGRSSALLGGDIVVQRRRRD